MSHPKNEVGIRQWFFKQRTKCGRISALTDSEIDVRRDDTE